MRQRLLKVAPMTRTQRTKQSYHLRKKFNITQEQVDELLNVKDCGICGVELVRGCKRDPNRACVDHDHETGEIRGVLCNSCNLLLGYSKDSIENLTKAVLYLTR